MVMEKMKMKLKRSMVLFFFALFLKLASAFVSTADAPNASSQHLRIYSPPTFLMYSERCCKTVIYGIFFISTSFKDIMALHCLLHSCLVFTIISYISILFLQFHKLQEAWFTHFFHISEFRIMFICKVNFVI